MSVGAYGHDKSWSAGAGSENLSDLELLATTHNDAFKHPVIPYLSKSFNP